jgi:hypothetical protein
MGLVAMNVCADAGTLNGGTVILKGLGPTTSTSVFSTQNVLVQAPFPEVNCPGGNVGGGICNFLGLPAQVTIQDLSIIFAQQGTGGYSAAPYNGLGFFNLDFGGGSTLTGFNLITNLPGLTNTRVSFTANSIQYNLAGLSFTGGDSIRLDLITSPEPSNMLLLACGLAVVGLLLRLERQSSTKMRELLTA